MTSSLPKTTPQFTADHLIAQVRALAKQHPNTIYEKPEGAEFCLYTEGAAGDGVGCIMGQALARLGVSADMIEPSNPDDGPGGIDVVLPRLGVETSLDQEEWLILVQTLQDTHNTWFDAVSAADSKDAISGI